MEAKDINITEIMDKIMAEAEVKRKSGDKLSFEENGSGGGDSASEFDRGVLELNLSLANLNHYLIYDQSPAQGGIKGRIKHMILKMNKFYMAPLVEEQRNFNGEVVRVLNNMYAYTKSLEKKVQEMQNDHE